jgi:hypothetical protein
MTSFMGASSIAALANDGALIADLKGIWRDAPLPPDLDRWSL